MSESVKVLPNNAEAERAVLGSILLDATGRNEDRVLDLCGAKDIHDESFYDPRNRAVFHVMGQLKQLSKPVDMVTVVEKLTNDGTLDGIGGIGYIQGLVDNLPSASHAEYYIDILRDKQLRRMMIDRARKTIEKCFDEGQYADPQAVLGDAERSFLEIGANGGATMPWSSAVQASFDKLNAMFSSKGNNLDGLSTGFRYLDEKLQGLKKSEMIVIAARPSVGKTSLAMNIAESVALGRYISTDAPCGNEKGKTHPVLIFSLEMPIESLTNRMVAGRAHVNTWKLNRNKLLPQERDTAFRNLEAAADALSKAPIYVDDTASLDVMDMRARARRMKKAHGIELIVIDYLQLCRCSEGARQSRQIEVSMISQQIKAMAKELKIPVIVLSQLSRANEQRGDKEEKPKLSDLRDSGAIEQDADVVFLLRRPSRSAQSKDVADETLAIVDIAKNRNGETGEVRMDFIREYVRFGDRAPAGTAEAALDAEAEQFDNATYSQPDILS